MTTPATVRHRYLRRSSMIVIIPMKAATAAAIQLATIGMS